MKQAILFAVFIAASHLSFANNNSPKKIYTDTTSQVIPEAKNMLSEIMSVTGLQSNFELKEADVLNIEASISHRKRYIFYNPAFISQINNVTKSKWASMFLLAHEVGHHLNGHTIRKSGSRPALELEADEFAGFVLYKLGASLEQSQEVMNFIAKTTASKTHPARASRMHAIQNGWNKAAENASIISTVRK